ncbi:Glycosyltransferase, catalytic subunit of cellulose synthase and poly-beta-1,6-N-acetylglucosamine synthase [Arthrobacter sp. ok909]|nr:Glycosyltransferase, catalytic subunit of cellulose synthase and poly-beta-1,6-N-acetylglucosamine synthase [Arthrobacter sp. ok909]
MTAGANTRDFSRLAGPLMEPPQEEKYSVRYRSIYGPGQRRKHLVSVIVGLFNVALFSAYVILLVRSISALNPEAGPVAVAANYLVVSSICLVAFLSVINVISFTVASIVARDPIPVRSQPGHRIAFVTAIVPAKESIHQVMHTLRAAQDITYEGTVDVWLLDEGGDPEIAALCQRHGIRYFSRHGIPSYNTASGAFKAKTKHGNYNAWLDSHGEEYDFLASVDNDHVPCGIFLERTLGYLRDEEMAYVVGPQAYGNVENFVARAAESQQFPFHSVIQRAANFYRIPMLVGTNYVLRISALREIGGFADSITEDMATGLRFHTSYNPATKGRWKSVYTPDVLSLGEGPSSWADYFGQQNRWSRGTFEVLRHEMPRCGWRLSPPRLLHYALITTFYPSMALGWLLGALNAVLFLTFGASGISVPLEVWIALYTDTTLFQLWVYGRNRRYNVSPVEPAGTLGLAGMAMSIVASPIYAAAFVQSIFGRAGKFAVTPKGAVVAGDSLRSYRTHFAWLAVFTAATAAALLQGYFTWAVYIWPAVAILTCLAPPVIHLHTRLTTGHEGTREGAFGHNFLHSLAPVGPAAEKEARV